MGHVHIYVKRAGKSNAIRYAYERGSHENFRNPTTQIAIGHQVTWHLDNDQAKNEDMKVGSLVNIVPEIDGDILLDESSINIEDGSITANIIGTAPNPDDRDRKQKYSVMYTLPGSDEVLEDDPIFWYVCVPSGASDRRLKSDIDQLTYGLGEVLKLNPVSYRFKGQNQRSLGLIAQEVEPLIDELVRSNGGEENYLSLDYNGFIPVLINAIQEQQKMLGEQQGQIDNLVEKLREVKQMFTPADTLA